MYSNVYKTKYSFFKLRKRITGKYYVYDNDKYTKYRYMLKLYPVSSMNSLIAHTLGFSFLSNVPAGISRTNP